MNPRRSEAHATLFYSCNGGGANSKDEQGLVCHKVVGGVNKANIFNVEQLRVHVDSLNGFKDGLVNDREEWHDKEVVRDSKVGGGLMIGVQGFQMSMRWEVPLDF